MSTPPILLKVTLPRVTGVPGMFIRAALGVSDLAEMFHEARVDSPRDLADGRHTTFLLQLEPDLEVGGQTKMGLLAIANDRGQIRVTTPWKWAPVLRRAGLHPRQAVDELGAPVAQMWEDAKPGRSMEFALPMKARLVFRIEVVESVEATA